MSFALGRAFEHVSPQSIAHLIGSIPRTTVRDFSLSLWILSDAATTAHDRDAVDDVLAHFVALRKLSVHVACAAETDSEVYRIWKAWPLTASKANVVVSIS
ncbi:hypothetical protein PHLGIDRAFT_297738 [Phlebiopsis gigantea 11061_1 CR5-6]|uniref:Uncharacterized protein n=1 Tax=Phlebiopsis gigantea (strain 11061_1 CR5-6) TaxID=745531 RepID=A0A0C3S0C6_PHLG1|nr:hypothetical protein PHLGIDRAFT_297738 [Phlebiopsis gigantea 11061_1 CR5-6]